MRTCFNTSKEITSRITNSHKFVGVVEAGGELGLELFLRGHLYHLILLCLVEPAVEHEPVVQAVLLPGGLLGVSLGEQPGTDAVGPGIFLVVHLG